MSQSSGLHENAVRHALDHAARESGASRGRPVDGGEADFLEHALHVVLGIHRRFLREYMQLAHAQPDIFSYGQIFVQFEVRIG